MRNTMKLIAIAAMSLTMISPALAQDQISVSTGAPSGNYTRIFKELIGVCGNQIQMVERASSGSLENINRIINNEVNAGFVQTDVLFFRQLTSDLNNIKTLISLYPEEVHVISPKVSPIKAKGDGFFNSSLFSNTAAVFNTFSDLAGQNIAVWGGSLVTAELIKLQSQISFNILEVEGYTQAKAAIDEGKAAAILMVGGHPMSDVAKLSNGYKLISFSDEVINKLKNVYVPANLNYSNMGQGGTGIKTIATEALFVTRTYRSPKVVNALSAVRTCFKDSLIDLQETIGTHPKWQVISAENKGKWAYYELPEIQPTQVKKK